MTYPYKRHPDIVPVLFGESLRFPISEGGGVFSDLEKEVYEYLVSHHSEYTQRYLEDLSWDMNWNAPIVRANLGLGDSRAERAFEWAEDFGDF